MRSSIQKIKRGGADLERLYLYDAEIKDDAGIIEVKKSRFPAVKDRGDVILRHIGRYGLALPFIRPGYRVLDFPCGSGLALEVFGPLQQFGRFSYEGRELDAPTVLYCRSVYGARYPFASFSLGDLTQFELKNETYDTLCCIEGIEHIDRNAQEMAVAQFARGLKHGGILVLSSPAPQSGLSGPNPKNPYHLFERNRTDLVMLLARSFEREHIEIISQENLLSTGEKTIVYYAFCHKPHA